MKNILILLILFPVSLMAKGARTPEEKLQAAVEKPFNPNAIRLPSREVLALVGVERVMDMGATSYANGFRYRALRFYNYVLELYPQEIESVTWARYEIAFIYYKMNQKKKALEQLDTIISLSLGDPITLRLAESLATRIRNPKEYRTYLKQEDILFAEEKRQRKLDDKQLAKEEAAIRKAQRIQEKENKRIQKIEKAEAKKAAKAQKAAEREARKNASQKS